MFTMWFQDFVTVFNQSYNCQTSHYLGRNRPPNACLSVLSWVLDYGQQLIKKIPLWVFCMFSDIFAWQARKWYLIQLKCRISRTRKKWFAFKVWCLLAQYREKVSNTEDTVLAQNVLYNLKSFWSWLYEWAKNAG